MFKSTSVFLKQKAILKNNSLNIRFFILIFTLALLLVLWASLPFAIIADERQDTYLYIARNQFENGKYREALINFEKASGYGELNPEDKALMGICYVKVKKFSKANELIMRALAINPDYPLILLAAGILYFDQKNYDRAYQYFNNAYELDRGLIQAKRGIISSLVNMGVKIYKSDRKKAKECFLKALELDPAFIPALQNLAVISFEEGNTEKALEYIDQALKYDPKNLKVLELKYYIYYKQKDYKNQIKVLLRLAILYPGNAEYWAMLGKTYEEVGDKEKSIEAFENARRYNSSNPYPYYRLAEYYFYKKKDRNKAIYTLREGIGKAIYMIGEIRISAAAEFQNKGKNLTKNDLKKIEKMAKSIETPKKILDDLLVLLRKLAENDDSYRKELSHLIELYPHTIELQIALARFYTEKGHYQEAIKLWRYILVKHSRSIDAYKGISYCYMKMGYIDRAIKSYKISLDIDPDDRTIYENLIKLHLKKRNIEELYNEWKERLYMDKRNPVLLRELAKVEKMLGKNRDAEKHFKRADIVEKENKEYEKKQKKKNED
ncbi:MAG: hypothetical protein DRP84_05585 [Spirochaetes bacterium]|nr:MAG: hypothetical protein DRP84_05585 [Spirochaetota bacterium]